MFCPLGGRWTGIVTCRLTGSGSLSVLTQRFVIKLFFWRKNQNLPEWKQPNLPVCVRVCVCQVLLPALMLTAAKDHVLLPALTVGMEEMVRRATTDCSVLADYYGMEAAAVVYQLIDWLIGRSPTWVELTSRTADTGLRWRDQRRRTRSWYRGSKRRTARRHLNCEGWRKWRKEGWKERRKEGKLKCLCLLIDSNKTFTLETGVFWSWPCLPGLTKNLNRGRFENLQTEKYSKTLQIEVCEVKQKKLLV